MEKYLFEGKGRAMLRSECCFFLAFGLGACLMYFLCVVYGVLCLVLGGRPQQAVNMVHSRGACTFTHPCLVCRVARNVQAGEFRAPGLKAGNLAWVSAHNPPIENGRTGHDDLAGQGRAGHEYDMT